MRLIERYLLRQTLSAFLVVLAVLTALVWVTQALQQLDVVTSQGQTIVVFLIVTGLILPSLMTLIAPAALFIATVTVLNRLGSDSEIVVMNAAGLSGRLLLRPFALLGVCLAGLIAVTTLVVQPQALRELRNWITLIQTDLVASLVREGAFSNVASGLMFHVQERAPNGALVGLFVQDSREPGTVTTYIAARGLIVKQAAGTVLVLENGSVQRQSADPESNNAFVVFESYALDLSSFQQAGGVTAYKPSERYTSELLFPDGSDPLYQQSPGRYRAELAARLVAPLYPVAFMGVALVFLGSARTTRQSRGGAVWLAISGVVGLRLVGFALETAAATSLPAAFAAVLLPLAAIIVCALVVLGQVRVPEMPDPGAVLARFRRRVA